VIATAVLFVSSMMAQPAPPLLSYSPGQKIVITATFEGADADHLAEGNFCFGLMQETALASQPSFSGQICSSGPDSKLLPLHTLEMTFTVPNNQAAGQYRLSQISINLKNPNINFIYGKDELPIRMVKIENPATATKPKLKDVQVH